MANFAVIDGDKVLNTIVADSKTIAEEVTGKTCIQFTNEPAEPNGFYIDGNFVQRKPFDSWVLNNYVWEAPVAKPEDGKAYSWDETTTSWIPFKQ